MVSDSSQSLLRRMASSRAEAPKGDDPNAAILRRAMATALLRVADAVQALGLTIDGQAFLDGGADEVFSDLPDFALCFMVDPPEVDQIDNSNTLARHTGVLAFDPALVDSLIEVQTIGRVDGPARVPRRPTRIDAALAQPFAQDLLAELVNVLPGDHAGARPGALRLGTFMAGPKSLPMTLTAPAFQRLDVKVALGQGSRPASISLIFPVPGDAEPGHEDDFVALDPAWSEAMDAVVRVAPVRLDVLLPAIRLPLSRLVGLKVGDRLDLDAGALESLRLVSGTSGLGLPNRRRMPRSVTLSARLGQLSGTRAVRITATPDEPAAPMPSGEAFPGLAAPTPDSASLEGPAPDPGALAITGHTGSGVDALAALPGADPTMDLDLSPEPSADLPDIPDLPDLPDIGGLTDPLAQTGGEDELPDLPGLDDLPPLP